MEAPGIQDWQLYKQGPGYIGTTTEVERDRWRDVLDLVGRCRTIKINIGPHGARGVHWCVYIYSLYCYEVLPLRVVFSCFVISGFKTSREEVVVEVAPRLDLVVRGVGQCR